MTSLSLANASWFAGTHGGLLPLNKEPGPSYLDRSQKANKEKDCHGSKGPAIDPRWTSDLSRRFTSMTLLAGLLNKEVTVYSHSLDNAIQLSSHSQVDFHLLGGNSTLKPLLL